MAKSKNHTNHNQNKKAHKNGIKRVSLKPVPPSRGMSQKFLKSRRVVVRRVNLRNRDRNIDRRKENAIKLRAEFRVCSQRMEERRKKVAESLAAKRKLWQSEIQERATLLASISKLD